MSNIDVTRNNARRSREGTWSRPESRCRHQRHVSVPSSPPDRTITDVVCDPNAVVQSATVSPAAHLTDATFLAVITDYKGGFGRPATGARPAPPVRGVPPAHAARPVRGAPRPGSSCARQLPISVPQADGSAIPLLTTWNPDARWRPRRALGSCRSLGHVEPANLAALMPRSQLEGSRSGGRHSHSPIPPHHRNQQAPPADLRRPMIYYPSPHWRDGIREVMVVVGGKSVGDVVELLADGEHFGVHLTYATSAELWASPMQSAWLGTLSAMRRSVASSATTSSWAAAGDRRTRVRDRTVGCRDALVRGGRPERFGVAELNAAGT